MIRRRTAAALLLLVALPAAAYILPVDAILRRVGEKRASLAVESLEVTGTFQAEGDAADRIAGAPALRAPGSAVSFPARLLLKVPGRCRLELVPPDVAEADRPYVALRDGRVTGRGLDAVPAAVALVRDVCALLAVPTAGDASRAYAAALARQGVSLGETSLGRFNGRVAYVIGGRERDAKPLAFVDKEGFQPLRLESGDGPARLDVRLLDWGSPTGGDWFPRAVEVWTHDALRIRFTTEKAHANVRVPDAVF